LGLFFLNIFKLFFKLCKLHSNNKTMHSNHDTQALLISNIIEMILNIKKTNLFDDLFRSLEKLNLIACCLY
jgi:hypothetical protein